MLKNVSFKSFQRLWKSFNNWLLVKNCIKRIFIFSEHYTFIHYIFRKFNKFNKAQYNKYAKTVISYTVKNDMMKKSW